MPSKLQMYTVVEECVGEHIVFNLSVKKEVGHVCTILLVHTNIFKGLGIMIHSNTASKINQLLHFNK